jgi:hypothetical protein
MRRYFLLCSKKGRCVTIWSRRFAVTALDGHETYRVGDDFQLYYPIPFLPDVDVEPLPAQEYAAQVVAVEPQLHLIVLQLRDGKRFDLSERQIYVLELEEKYPARDWLMHWDIPYYDFGPPLFIEEESWMDFAFFGLSAEFGRGGILSKPVIDL